MHKTTTIGTLLVTILLVAGASAAGVGEEGVFEVKQAGREGAQ